MPKDKSAEHETQETCTECNPPDHVRQELGSGIGGVRHRHYLTFKSTDDLEKHLRAVAYFKPPEKGLDFDGWLAGVISWHRSKRAIIAADERRWGK